MKRPYFFVFCRDVRARMNVTVQSFKELRRFQSADYSKTTLQKYLILCSEGLDATRSPTAVGEVPIKAEKLTARSILQVGYQY
jgi:hypothetical protein